MNFPQFPGLYFPAGGGFVPGSGASTAAGGKLQAGEVLPAEFSGAFAMAAISAWLSK